MSADERADDDVAAFERGLQTGLDPQPTSSEFGSDGHAVTQLSSTWSRRECPTCGHTFRRGDGVVRDATTGQVRHLDPALGCAVTGSDAQPSPDGAGSDPALFADGLLAAWPTLNDVPVTRLTANAWQVGRPPGRSPLCQGCGHTFRAGESVIICPCHPHEPGECVTAIHRDAGAGLPCWERTRPDGKVEVCPWRLVRVGAR